MKLQSLMKNKRVWCSDTCKQNNKIIYWNIHVSTGPRLKKYLLQACVTLVCVHVHKILLYMYACVNQPVRVYCFFQQNYVFEFNTPLHPSLGWPLRKHLNFRSILFKWNIQALVLAYMYIRQKTINLLYNCLSETSQNDLNLNKISKHLCCAHVLHILYGRQQKSYNNQYIKLSVRTSQNELKPIPNAQM